MKMWGTPVIIFGSVLGVAGYFSLLGIDANHDGVIFKPALDVANGKVLFRDVFSHYGAMTSYLHAGALYVFGKKLIVIKLVTAIAYALAGLVMWGICREVMGRRGATLTTLGWLGLAPYFGQHAFAWPSAYGALMQTLAVWLVLRKKIGWELGMVAAAAFWFKQSYLLLPVALAVVLWRHEKIKAVVTGMAGVSVMAMLPIVVSGGLGAWWKQNIWVGYINGRILGSQYDWRLVGKLLAANPVWLVVPLICLAMWILFVIQGKRTEAAAGWLAVVSLVQYYPLADFSHMYWAVTPAFWLAGYGIYRLWRGGYRPVAVLAGLIIAGGIATGLNTGWVKVKTDRVTITRPSVLSGMKLTKEEAEFYRDVSDRMDQYLGDNPGKEFVILSSDALYMTFTPRARNTLSMYANYSGVTSGVYAYDEALTEFINNKKPLVLADGEAKIPTGYTVIKEWPQYKMKLISKT
ncbi:MAG: hypothetical protein UX91_C0007G0015 [Candidatus Amesbacteria bacterium GW2011_GWB1_47_19]|nr:MAG: hypothetical protein UW51_C0006G0164 [Candidatus Amesbacteria bacterium GW2011_GWA1_44_24]KKU31799.1 MAG: hypothetical protein UX46_C0002G0015 [Candidatus Amesbacteria bacterium GW2011_GWC1_46_24]KKU66735.1 MAG: hypothetical protein UX91_C0007G0015 [Candidatus Amesbacteria bacterium GW2011_GWB1_47_19]OGD05710.1 MAG: hypothetical protein A2379_00590 [Candidatus Amesbacteria bacterium RIFOXYB1_FULL_47_13]